MAKESLYGIGNHLVFRETFNDPEAVSRNDGTISGISFKDGIGIFDGASHIAYGKLKTMYDITIRARIKPTGDGTIIAQGSSDFRIRINGGIYYVSARSLANVNTGLSAINDKWQIVTLTSNSLDSYFYLNDTKVLATGSSGTITQNIWTIGARLAPIAGLFFNGEIDLIEIYDKVLSDEEVSLLNKNLAYKKVNKPLLYSFSPVNGYYESNGEDIDTITGVEMVRQGAVWASRCNGTTSNISLDNSITLGTQFSFFVWAKLRQKNDYHAFVASSDFSAPLIFQDLGSYALISHNGTHFTSVALTNFDKDKWGFLGIVRNDNVCEFYYQNESIGTGTLSSNFSISIDRLFIRNLSFTVLGDVGEMFIYQDILSDEEVSQLYNSTKFKYIQ